MSIARTPAPPYYAVIFTSLRTEGDHGYASMADASTSLEARRPALGKGVQPLLHVGARACHAA
jgi:hypothetical protein